MFGSILHMDNYCSHSFKNLAIRLKKFIRGEMSEIKVRTHKIVFAVEGVINVSVAGSAISVKLSKNEFVFIPMGATISCQSDEDTSVLFILVTDSIDNCSLSRSHDSSDIITNNHAKIHVLTANRHIKRLINGVMDAMNNHKQCSCYLQLKAIEFIFLLRLYYQRRDYEQFFASILSADMEFSEFIRLHYYEYKSVADIAQALNMSVRKFSDKFKLVFGTVPRKWIQMQQAQHIYTDICQINKPIKEIVDKYGFSAHSNFTRYCRKTYGATPKNIRKKL